MKRITFDKSNTIQMKIKSLATIFLLVAIIHSCKENPTTETIKKIDEPYVARKIDSVTITPLGNSISSHRTLTIIDKKPYLAGSNGSVYGLFSNDSGFETFIQYDTLKPHFRASAFNGESYFALSVGNPALLYKFEPNRNVAPVKKTNANTEYWLPKGETFFDAPTYYTHYANIVYKEEHEKVFYDALAFFDTQNGIAMGDPTEDCLSIILTKDGGNTWQKIPCNNLSKTEEGEAAFAASNGNIAIVGTNAWLVTGGKRARVFHTPDMGKTWKVYDTPIVEGGQMTGIYSVDFYDSKNGIIFGGDWSKKDDNIANKAITNDGGQTWQLIADGEGPGYKSCVQYVPETNGKELFAVGSTGISFSNDGGHSWKKVSNEAYYTIRFVNKNIAWLAGNKKIGKMILE